MKRTQSILATLIAIALTLALLTGSALARPSTTPISDMKTVGQLGYASTNTTISATADPTIFKIEHTLNAYITPGTLAIVIVLDNSGSMGNPHGTLVTTTGGHPVFDGNLLPLEYLRDPLYHKFFPAGATYIDPVSNTTYTNTTPIANTNPNWVGGGYRWEWAIWGAEEATRAFLDEAGINPRAKDTAVAYVAFGSAATPVFSENFHVSNNSTMNASMGTSYPFAGDYNSTTNGALRFVNSQLLNRSGSSTNIQAGLIAAYDYLKAINADRKFVLFLGDGEPNGGSQETIMQVAAAIKAPTGGSSIAGRSPLGAEIYAINLASVYDYTTNTDQYTPSASWLSGTWLRDGIYGTNGVTGFGSQQTLIAIASVLSNSYYNTSANFVANGLATNAAAIQSSMNFSETVKRYTYVAQASTNPTPAQATKNAFTSFAQTILAAGSGAQMTAELNSMFTVVSYQGAQLFTTTTTDSATGATGGTGSLSGSTITWSIPEAPNGKTLTLTYYVQINTSGLSPNTYYNVLNDAYVTYAVGGTSYCINYPLPQLTIEGASRVIDNTQDATIGGNGSTTAVPTSSPTPTISQTLYSPSSRPYTSSSIIFDLDYNAGISPGPTPPPAASQVAALATDLTASPTPTPLPEETENTAVGEESPSPSPQATIEPVIVNEGTWDYLLPLTDGILLIPLALIGAIAYGALHTQHQKRKESE